MNEEANKKQLAFAAFIGWMCAYVFLRIMIYDEYPDVGFWKLQLFMAILVGIILGCAVFFALCIRFYDWLGTK